ncbi:hypothetical protein M501DRAFT_986128 [Patellaria atrata CBS 101060]|uniref:Uncharacterized protein n=1 Tax=Patellaria atrata CBS 101060 TaxID=1346257 RepID=A0A9P4S8M7_9PEZI|nr:hypothetical protein M501DRAFT_986128 [Patellaria atrata CBS 101060]
MHKRIQDFAAELDPPLQFEAAGATPTTIGSAHPTLAGEITATLVLPGGEIVSTPLKRKRVPEDTAEQKETAPLIHIGRTIVPPLYGILCVKILQRFIVLPGSYPAKRPSPYLRKCVEQWKRFLDMRKDDLEGAQEAFGHLAAAQRKGHLNIRNEWLVYRDDKERWNADFPNNTISLRNEGSDNDPLLSGCDLGEDLEIPDIYKVQR